MKKQNRSKPPEIKSGKLQVPAYKSVISSSPNNSYPLGPRSELRACPCNMQHQVAVGSAPQRQPCSGTESRWELCFPLLLLGAACWKLISAPNFMLLSTLLALRYHWAHMWKAQNNTLLLVRFFLSSLFQVLSIWLCSWRKPCCWQQS